MTVVLVFGDVPSTGHVPRSGAERVNVSDAEGTVPPDAVLDLVRSRLDTADYAVALYPSWRPEPARRALRLAHASLATERLILVPCALPPLGFALVADQLGYLAPYCPPGALVGIMSALERVTLSGAWVRGVAGLEQIPASLSDHVASYVPGSGFMVTAAPATRVHRITGSAPLAELPYRPADPVHVLTGNSEGDTDWLETHLLPALHAQRVRNLAAPPLGEAYWGTKKYLEFVAFSGHPKALSVIANSVQCRPCPWCAELVATPTCPLCSMVSAYRRAAGQGQEPESSADGDPAYDGEPAVTDAHPQASDAAGLDSQTRNGAL